MPASNKKVVAGEDYKGAVKKRQNDVFKQQANEIVRKAQDEKRLNEAKRANYVSRKQKKIDAKKAEISTYNAKLKEAERTVKNDSYGLISIGALIMFGLLIIIALIFRIKHYDTKYYLTALIVGLFFVIIAVISLASGLEAESNVKEYQEKLNRAKQELENLTKSPFA